MSENTNQGRDAHPPAEAGFGPSMTIRLPFAAAVLVTVFAGPCLAEPFETWSSNFYALRVDPRGGEGPRDPGWGFGGEGAWYFSPIPRAFTLKLGADGGNIDSDDEAILPPGASQPIVLVTSHDYFRIFGGLDVGVHGRARIQPHTAVHVALVRQDFRALRFDTTFGEFQEEESDSDTGFGYDVTAGIAVRLTRRLRLDGGVRYMRVPKVSTRVSADPEFALLYLGLGFQTDR